MVQTPPDYSALRATENQVEHQKLSAEHGRNALHNSDASLPGITTLNNEMLKSHQHHAEAQAARTEASQPGVGSAPNYSVLNEAASRGTDAISVDAVNPAETGRVGRQTEAQESAAAKGIDTAKLSSQDELRSQAKIPEYAQVPEPPHDKLREESRAPQTLPSELAHQQYIDRGR